MARLGWSLPLPGPLRVSGDFRSRPSTAGADLARRLEVEAARRDARAEQDAAHRAELAGLVEAAWPHLDDAARGELEAAVVHLADAPLGSMRSSWRAGKVMHLVAAADRA